MNANQDRYKLRQVAQKVAKKYKLELSPLNEESKKSYPDLYGNFSFFNRTDFNNTLFIEAKGGQKIFLGSLPNSEKEDFIHYEGAYICYDHNGEFANHDATRLRRSKGNSVLSISYTPTKGALESLHVKYLGKLLAITWGASENVGHVEIANLKASSALEELSGDMISRDPYPQSKPLEGVAQFKRKNFNKLYSTIKTLLE